MRILLTGGSGVLGRAALPLLRQAGHQVDAPGHDQLDLYDPRAVTAAARNSDAILHLVSRTPPPHARGQRDAWTANDRLRRDATGILVDAALTTGVQCFLFPSLAFIYPPTGPADESTPLPEDVYEIARSAVDGEHHVERFTARGRRGVVLRLGMLYGPGTDSDTPAEQDRAYGATLAIADAGQAITAALQAPAGIYNVVADGQRVSNARFKQATDWTPT